MSPPVSGPGFAPAPSYGDILAALASDPDGMLAAERAAVRWVAASLRPEPAELHARELAGLMAAAQAWPAKATETRQSRPHGSAAIPQPADQQKPLADHRRGS